MQRAAFLLLTLAGLAACGGGGGGGDAGSPAGPASPSSGSPAPTPPAATVVPQFTRQFAQFIGTPVATIAADVDGDGADDLVVVTRDHFASGPGSDTVEVFYQRGGALVGLGASTLLAMGDRTETVAACDVDGDGQKELLVGYSSTDLAIFRPAPDGTPVFSSRLAGVRSQRIYCLDVDGDGLSDVVTLGTVGRMMRIHLQRGGTLVEEETYPGPTGGFSGPFALAAVGDLNADGKADVVLKVIESAVSTFRLVVYLQTTPGRFAAPVALNVGGDLQFAESGAIGDLVPGGNLNLVHAIQRNSPAARIYVSTHASNGAVQGSVDFPTYDLPSSLYLDDVNSDGRPDILVVHSGFGQVGIHLQNADGTFQAAPRLDLGFADQTIGMPAIATGDFNSDGKRDIAVTSQSALFVFLRN